ncbi:MAG: DNA repair exonuclease [Oscillospiraceae bacterium]|nr:DNA repair exonuclease [Oscillospiraceae bacterium]
MIKFLHAADLHLDTTFSGGGAERRQEQRQMVTELLELADAQTCDLVLLAGDLFEGENVYPETRAALRRALAACRAQIFIAPGNHDYLWRGSPYVTDQWPENVHIFKESAIEAVTIRDLGCRVYGAGFTNAHMGGLLTGFRTEQDGLFNLMVLHGDAATADSAYNPITKAEIEESGLDYLALGHIHLREAPHTVGKTTYAWPGCPMGRGFDETGEKGVYIGTLDQSGCKLTFHPLSVRKYEDLEVRADGNALESILAKLPENTENDIYRITLTGQSDPTDIAALRDALEPRFYKLILRDRTEPLLDLWEGAGENTLRGQFLARLQAQLGGADDETQRKIRLAAKIGLAALEGRDEVIDA